MWSQKQGMPDAASLKWKNKLIELMDNRIITLKRHNSNNNPTGTSSIKTTFIKNSLQHIHDQVVVASIDKDNRYVAFICKCF